MIRRDVLTSFVVNQVLDRDMTRFGLRLAGIGSRELPSYILYSVSRISHLVCHYPYRGVVELVLDFGQVGMEGFHTPCPTDFESGSCP